MQQPLRKDKQTSVTLEPGLRSAQHADVAARRRRADRNRQGGRSGPAGHRAAETPRWRLPGAVQQCQRQAEPSCRHQSVRRYGRSSTRCSDGRTTPSASASSRMRCRIRSSRSGSTQSDAPCQEHVIEKPKRRQRIDGADPAHNLRTRTHRRLRHSLRHRRAIRWRLRPRLQPHELPLGQCRHVPDLARLAHVAGGQQVLQGRPAGADHHVLRRAAGLHAAGRGRLRLRHDAAGLRRDRHRRRRAGLADPPRQGAHRRRHGARRLPNWCWRATSIRATAASRPRKQRTPAFRAAITSIRNGRATWGSPTRRRPSM